MLKLIYGAVYATTIRYEGVPVKVYYVKRLLPSWATAQTWRRTIFIRHGAASIIKWRKSVLINHELVHAMQWEKYGIFFPFVYAWASVQAWRQGKHYYKGNRFEVEAEERTKGLYS